MYADSTRGFIEGDADEAVLKIFDVTRQGDAVRHAIVDIFAVWGEGWEGLKLQTVTEQWRRDDAMLLHVGHIDIRPSIKDFEALARHAVESRNDLLGGVSDIAPGRTESEIDAARDIQLTQLTMLIQNSATTRTTDIHHRKLRILVGEGVAVHTTVFQLLIVTEGIGFKILYATLLNLYLVPDLVVGLYQTIGEIGINLVFDNLPSEGLILNPLIID